MIEQHTLNMVVIINLMIIFVVVLYEVINRVRLNALYNFFMGFAFLGQVVLTIMYFSGFEILFTLFLGWAFYRGITTRNESVSDS